MTQVEEFFDQQKEHLRKIERIEFMQPSATPEQAQHFLRICKILSVADDHNCYSGVANLGLFANAEYAGVFNRPRWIK